MSKHQEMYKQKLKSADEIVKQIKSGDMCVSPSALGEPQALVDALTARAMKEGLTGITHNLLLPCRKWGYLAPECAGHVTLVSWFTSGAARAAIKEGRADFIPNFYYEVPRYYEEGLVPQPDVAYAMVSPMDKHGWMSTSIGASESLAQLHTAKLKFVECNPNMPRAHGMNFIHISEVDAVCESNLPLPELPEAPVTEKDQTIGEFIVERIKDGACIQLGIGGMPNVVGKKLMSRKNLGIHTEMFTETLVDLIESGAVDNTRKATNKGKSVASFAFGSKRMYDFIDDNPGVEFHSIGYVNDPRVISQNDNMVSINACVEVDLIGQVCSESVGPRNISGTGGQCDFTRGANWSKGGQGFIATFSTTPNDAKSCIVPTLTPGAHVTTSKNDVDHIVTEYGIAKLKGKTASQRAKALIAISHPKFREELTAAAKKMNLMI